VLGRQGNPVHFIDQERLVVQGDVERQAARELIGRDGGQADRIGPQAAGQIKQVGNPGASPDGGTDQVAAEAGQFTL
jgi:hypothetical protein